MLNIADKRSIAIMNSEKTAADNVSFKVFLRNPDNEGEAEVKRFVVDSDAATSITYLKVMYLSLINLIQ